MSNLQPKQFWYHISKGDMQPGDRVQSANLRGAGPYMGNYRDWTEPDGTNRGDWVYAAATEVEAQQWTPPWFPGGRKGFGYGRATVYEVEPAPGKETRIEKDHHRLPGAKTDHLMTRDEMIVKRRIDIPEPLAMRGEVAMQGTLPPEDWTVYGAHNAEPVLSPLDREARVVRRKPEPTPGDEAREYEAKWEKAGQGRLL